jgi:hypothetical protein
MTSEEVCSESRADGPAVDMMVDLIAGVKVAFDRDPDMPQSAENMLGRFAESLLPIATFLNRLPPLGPKYGNHFDELASALKDWREGRYHPLFDVQVRRTGAKPSYIVRGWVNVVLAVEALKESGRAFNDAHRAIDDYPAAITELLREFSQLKAYGGKSGAANTIKTWRTEFTRTNREQDAWASELLEMGRIHIERLGNDCAALHKFARVRVQAAVRDFDWIRP